MAPSKPRAFLTAAALTIALAQCSARPRSRSATEIPGVPPPAPDVPLARLLPRLLGGTVRRADLTETHYTWAHERLAIHDGRAQWGTPRFGPPIASATVTNTGWLFIDARGAVAHAPAFTEPLRSLGYIPGESLRMLPSTRGRAVYLEFEPRPRAYATDGRGPFEPLRALDDEGGPLWVSFADADHGAAITDGGRLLHTRDGGRSWRALHLDEVVRYGSFDADPPRWLLQTPLGPRHFRLDPDGTLTPQEDPAPWAQRPVSADELRRLLPHLLAHEPELRIDPLSGVQTASGVGLLRIEGVSDVRGSDLLCETDGSGLSSHGCVEPPTNDCGVYRWGAAVLVLCEDLDGDPPPRLVGYRLSPDGARHPVRIEPWRADYESVTPFAVDPSGDRLAWVGSCAEESENDEAVRRDSVCVVTGANGDGPRGTIALPEPAATIVGFTGNDLVIEPEEFPASPLMLVDLATGNARSGSMSTSVRALPEFAGCHDDGSGSNGRATLTDDGFYYRVIRARPTMDPSIGQCALLAGWANGTLTVRPLPPTAEIAGFLSSDRGFALGSNGPFSTSDGGGTWAPVALDGATAWPEGMYADSALECTPTACSANVRWERWTEEDQRLLLRWGRPVREPLHTATEPAPPSQPRPPDTTSALPSVALACNDTGHARRPTVGAAPARGTERETFAGAGIVGEVRRARGRLQALWRDANGAAHATRTEPARWDLPGGVNFLGAGARGLLLERCVRGPEWTCERYWAADGGSLTALEARTPLPYGPSGESPPVVAPADDGGVWLAGNVSDQRLGGAHVTPDGRVTDVREFAVARDWTRLYGLARIEGRWSVLVDALGTEPMLLAYALEGPRSRPVRFPAPRLDVCAGARSADAVDVFMMLPDPATPRRSRLTGRFEYTGAVPCLRALQRAEPVASGDRPEGTWQASTAGELAGFSHDEAERAAQRCTVTVRTP